MIDIKNLNIFYKNLQILKNINFYLKSGQVCGIMGKSGSGKSIFAKSFIRLFDDDFFVKADKFCVDGDEILNFDKKTLSIYRKKVALIFQNSLACLHPMLNVGDHFNFYFDKNIKSKAFLYFKNFGFSDPDLLWHKFPYELSGGEATRIAIVLALLSNPKILICDEITNGLDTINQKSIIEILKNLKNDLNIIFISHQENITKYLCDEIWLMNDGNLTKC